MIIIIYGLVQLAVKCFAFKEKTIVEFFLNNAAYSWVLQQFKLLFWSDSTSTQWNVQQ